MQRVSTLRLLALLIGVAATGAAAERDIVRTFPVGAAAGLAIDTYRGAITVVESDQPVIRIAVHLEIGSETEAEAEEMLRTLQLDFQASGDAVTVTSRRPAETRVRFVWNERKQIEPTYRVTVPRRCNLDLKTRRGAIVVGSIEGVLRVRADAGDLFFRQVGGTVDARTGEGDIVISRCAGTVTARASQGLIRLGPVTGRCDVSSEQGDVELLAIKGDVVARAGVGVLTAAIHRDFAGRADLATTFGPLVVKVDPAAKCRIEATTSLFAEVRCRLPLATDAGRAGRRSVAGTMNGGAAPVVVRGSGGDVTLLPVECPFP